MKKIQNSELTDYRESQDYSRQVSAATHPILEHLKQDLRLIYFTHILDIKILLKI